MKKNETSDQMDKTTEALVESYKKAESWQIRRQILSVLAVSNDFIDIKTILPEVTEYRYYVAKNTCLSKDAV